MQLTDKLEFVNRRIEDLENTETDMLQKLQRSINEHNKLLAQTRVGNLEKGNIKIEVTRRLHSTTGLR